MIVALAILWGGGQKWENNMKEKKQMSTADPLHAHLETSKDE